MLVEHTKLSIREGVYPFVHIGEWEEFSRVIRLDVGRRKDATDDVLASRRDAWNRLTANFFDRGDWEIVCEWVKEVLYNLDTESRLLIEEQGDAVSEVMLGVIKERHTNWKRFREKVELTMMEKGGQTAGGVMS